MLQRTDNFMGMWTEVETLLASASTEALDSVGSSSSPSSSSSSSSTTSSSSSSSSSPSSQSTSSLLSSSGRLYYSTLSGRKIILRDESSSQDDSQPSSLRTNEHSSSDELTLNGEKAYVIREIRDHRYSGKRKEFLVHWDGYPSSDASWVAAKDVSKYARDMYNPKKSKTN